MKRRILLAAVIAVLGSAEVASAAPPPTVPPSTAPASTGPAERDEATIFGVGPSGSGPVWPVCGALTYVDTNTGNCLPTSTPIPTGTTALAIDASCPIEGDLEGAFTAPDQMRTFVECILPVAVSWLSWEYTGLTPPAEWARGGESLLPLNFLYVPTGAASTPETQGCSYDDMALQYCMLDGNVYLGEQVLWLFYSEFGDAAVSVAISHEMGHRVQHLAGEHVSMTTNEGIPLENQADCFAGAFMDYADRNNHMDPTGDDVIDTLEGLIAIGEQEGQERSHGTIDQRVRAFYVGYNSPDSSGVFACDFFVTDISIVPASFSTS